MLNNGLRRLIFFTDLLLVLKIATSGDGPSFEWRLREKGFWLQVNRSFLQFVVVADQLHVDSATIQRNYMSLDSLVNRQDLMPLILVDVS